MPEDERSERVDELEVRPWKARALSAEAKLAAVEALAQRYREALERIADDIENEKDPPDYTSDTATLRHLHRIACLALRDATDG